MFGSKLLQSVLSGLTWLGTLRGRGFPQRWLLNRILKHNKAPGFRELLDHPDGYPVASTKSGSFLGKRVTTENGKVQLAPSDFVARLAALATPASGTTSPGDFRLISKRRHNTHNSWTQNVASLTRGDNEQTNVAYMNPADLAGLKLSAGSAVDITSAAGSIRLPVAALQTLERGLVSVPHGWGHQHAQ